MKNYAEVNEAGIVCHVGTCPDECTPEFAEGCGLIAVVADETTGAPVVRGIWDGAKFHPPTR